MSKFALARDLIRNRSKLLIVNDGMFRWVGRKTDITAWLNTNGFSARTARSMTAQQYQDLCDSTSCESDCVATVGNGNLVRFVNLLESLGVDELHVA